MMDEGDDGARVGVWVTAGVITLLLSGFHDASGDPAKNAELAKQRAKALRAAFVAAGLEDTRVLMRKPESTQANGKAEEARRVEVHLVS